jgi:hypothetical protein
MGLNVDNLQGAKIQVQSYCALAYLLGVSKEHGPGNLLVHQGAAGV